MAQARMNSLISVLVLGGSLMAMQAQADVLTALLGAVWNNDSKAAQM